MIFLAWTMDLGTNASGGLPDFESPELWERWLFLSLLLMPISLMSSITHVLLVWKRENTLSLLRYTEMSVFHLWIPLILFFLFPLFAWLGLREGLHPILLDEKGRMSNKKYPVVLEHGKSRWTLFPDFDLMRGQALLEREGQIRHYQSWVWSRRGIALYPGENLSHTSFLVADQTELRGLCRSPEQLFLLRGLGGGFSLELLWEYRHLEEAIYEIIKRVIQPFVLFLILCWNWCRAIRNASDRLVSEMAKSSLLFGFGMLAMEVFI